MLPRWELHGFGFSSGSTKTGARNPVGRDAKTIASACVERTLHKQRTVTANFNG